MAKPINKLEWKNLKRRIESEDQKTLVELIRDLFELSTNNHDFLCARYADADTALKRYKKVVSDAIYPDFMNNRHARIDFARARKAVSDFKHACSNPDQILDLMIHYVEIGTRQANDICVDYEAYYTRLESMFSSVIRMLGGKKEYRAKFLPRLKKIIKNATDGYGYRDTLEDQMEGLIGEGGQA